MTVRRQGELAGVSVLTAGDAHLQEVTHGIYSSGIWSINSIELPLR